MIKSHTKTRFQGIRQFIASICGGCRIYIVFRKAVTVEILAVLLSLYCPIDTKKTSSQKNQVMEVRGGSKLVCVELSVCGGHAWGVKKAPAVSVLASF